MIITFSHCDEKLWRQDQEETQSIQISSARGCIHGHDDLFRRFISCSYQNNNFQWSYFVNSLKFRSFFVLISGEKSRWRFMITKIRPYFAASEHLPWLLSSIGVRRRLCYLPAQSIQCCLTKLLFALFVRTRWICKPDIGHCSSPMALCILRGTYGCRVSSSLPLLVGNLQGKRRIPCLLHHCCCYSSHRNFFCYSLCNRSLFSYSCYLEDHRLFSLAYSVPYFALQMLASSSLRILELVYTVLQVLDWARAVSVWSG